VTRFLLKRTHIEEFEYDPDKLKEQFADEWVKYVNHEMTWRHTRLLPPLTEGEHWHNFLIELFDKHDGSAYGDTLFSSTASDDFGVELFTMEDDE
jgi:hypothetical protein